MTGEEKLEQLEAIASEIAECVKCPLHEGRSCTVPGEGNPNSPLLFIGEAPGFHEDQQGRPFVGAAGQFLESLLKSIGVSREQVFIANVVKCRPPDNRDPETGEISACNTYLDRQIEAIDPLVIVTLGRYSLGRYLPGERISRIHGQPRQVGSRTIMPMYHPAAALHRGALRREIEADFAKIPDIVREVRQSSAEQQNDEQPAVESTPPPEQLSLL
ncbi:MAG: uracil-DNA glycosylase [Dehalococcoidia bacterium]|nr:uracil-DNA glycosylase [Dehalococcoidia bacterium]